MRRGKKEQGITKSPRLFDAKTRSRDIEERNQRLRGWRMRDAMQEVGGNKEESNDERDRAKTA